MRGVQELGRPRAAIAGDAGGGADLRALFDQWFDSCVDVAYRILHDADEAADVVRHTFLAARPGTSGGPRRGAPFGTWALRTTRDEALNRRSRRWRSPPPEQPPRAASGARDEAAEVAWAAFAALGASDASALDLHLRHDFSVADVAEALGVSVNEAHQLLFRLKRRLGAAVRAWAVWPWRDDAGGMLCPDLRAAVESSGVREFGSQAVQVIHQHARTCRDCQARQRLGTAPEATFAAVPVMPAGSLLRDRVVAALETAGIPLEPRPAQPSPPDPPAAAPSSGAPAASPPTPAGVAGVAGIAGPVATPAAPPPPDALPRRRPGPPSTPASPPTGTPAVPPSLPSTLASPPTGTPAIPPSPPPPPPPGDPHGTSPSLPHRRPGPTSTPASSPPADPDGTSPSLPRRRPPAAGESPNGDHLAADGGDWTESMPAAHMARPEGPRGTTDDPTTGAEQASHLARPGPDGRQSPTDPKSGPPPDPASPATPLARPIGPDDPAPVPTPSTHLTPTATNHLPHPGTGDTEHGTTEASPRTTGTAPHGAPATPNPLARAVGADDLASAPSLSAGLDTPTLASHLARPRSEGREPPTNADTGPTAEPASSADHPARPGEADHPAPAPSPSARLGTPTLASHLAHPSGGGDTKHRIAEEGTLTTGTTPHRTPTTTPNPLARPGGADGPGPAPSPGARLDAPTAASHLARPGVGDTAHDTTDVSAPVTDATPDGGGATTPSHLPPTGIAGVTKHGDPAHGPAPTRDRDHPGADAPDAREPGSDDLGHASNKTANFTGVAEHTNAASRTDGPSSYGDGPSHAGDAHESQQTEHHRPGPASSVLVGASGAGGDGGRPGVGGPLSAGGEAARRVVRPGSDGSRIDGNGAAGTAHAGGRSAHGRGGVDGGPAHASGERPAIRPYTYRRPRPDRRRVVGVALAVVLVLGASLAIVGFTQGSSGSPASSRDTTSVPSNGSSTTADAAGQAPPTEPGSTVVPTTVAPPASAPGGGLDADDATGDQAGAPEIARFAVTEQGLGTPCGAAQRRITFAWESTGATSAQLDGPGAPTDALPPTGEAPACRDAGPPETYTLTVTGPGGTSFRTATV